MSGVGPYQDAEVVKKWPDGYKMVRLYTYRDLVTLEKNGGGCSAAHFFWTEEADPILEYFFVLLDMENSTDIILFAKLFSMLNKPHPQERAHGYPPYTYVTRDQKTATNSTAYDYMIRPLLNPEECFGEEIKLWERRLQDEKNFFIQMRQQAIEQHGPLNKDHPDKRDIDEQNRHVASCKAHLDSLKKRRPYVKGGQVFTWGDKELIAVQIVGRGGYRLKDDSVPSRKMSDFIFGEEA